MASMIVPAISCRMHLSFEVFRSVLMVVDRAWHFFFEENQIADVAILFVAKGSCKAHSLAHIHPPGNDDSCEVYSRSLRVYHSLWYD